MNKNKSNITNKVLYMAAVSMILVTAVFLVIYVGYKKDYEEALERANNGKIIVALNEVDRLLIDEDNTGFYKDSQVKDNIDSLIVDLQDDATATYKNDLKYITIFYITSMLAIIIIYCVIYIMVNCC